MWIILISVLICGSNVHAVDCESPNMMQQQMQYPQYVRSLETQQIIAEAQYMQAMGRSGAGRSSASNGRPTATNGRPGRPTAKATSEQLPNQSADLPTAKALERFSAKLFQEIAPSNVQHNIVYSPISLHTLLAFVYMGAEGQTAQELQQALELPKNRNQVPPLFQSVTKTPANVDDPKLTMANKMYYNYNLVANNFNDYGQNHFKSETEATNFAEPLMAAQQINSWISRVTSNQINNLVAANTLDAKTMAILVNAIYFKAKWENPFSTSDTEVQDFYSSNRYSVPVEMMYNDDKYRFAVFPNLQAKVLELPYKNSNLSMLIILPNNVEGLAALEQNLRQTDLSSIANALNWESVIVRLPKFRIEFDVDMLKPLMRLGISQLFSNHATLTGFFRGNEQPLGISKVQHKAYITVNEAGSEAAAASFAKLIPLALQPNQVEFTADHPFMFAIRDANAVYFIGHVVSF